MEIGTDMSMKAFARYAAVQRQIKFLQAEADGLKPKIMAEMAEMPNDTRRYTGSDGSEFSLSYRKKWSYSSNVVEAEEMVKGMKRAEEKSGTATYEESPVLSVKLGPATYMGL